MIHAQIVQHDPMTATGCRERDLHLQSVPRVGEEVTLFAGMEDSVQFGGVVEAVCWELGRQFGKPEVIIYLEDAKCF